MNNNHFLNQAISPWMKLDGPESDVVLSTRVRLARNFSNLQFPSTFSNDDSQKVVDIIEKNFNEQPLPSLGTFQIIKMDDLSAIDKTVLVEKHLISPHLMTNEHHSASLISENEEVSIMINEEDHLRIQCMSTGLQLHQTLETASRIDDWLESEIVYAFDEEIGYLTSCPSNVGTGLRASVMMHLPAVVETNQIEEIAQSIQKLGHVVRGVYGEGSRSIGHVFQFSNQITLGKSETAVIADLETVVKQIIAYEKAARDALLRANHIQIEDKVFRSLGTLLHARTMESTEAAKRLSDVRLGIDLGLITDIPKSTFNELMVAIQSGFLQRYAGKQLSPFDRDVFRANLIREHLQKNK